MLEIYGTKWCPNCTKTVEYLKNNGIEFEYFEIEKQSENTIQKIMWPGFRLREIMIKTLYGF